MTRLDPGCPICKGIGWYEAPNYSGFVPTIEPTPCPNCHNLTTPTKYEVVCLALGFLIIAVFLLTHYAGAR